MKDKKEKTAKSGIFKVVRQTVLNGLLFLGLIFLTFWFIFKDQDLGEVFKEVSNAVLPFVIAGLALMGCYLAIEAWNLKRLITAFGDKITYPQAFRYACVCQFFSAVTPSATGGQPLEIYYMSKDGIPAAHGTISAILMTAGIEFAVVILGLIGGIFHQDQLTGPMLWLYLYGILINSITFLVLTICVFWTRGVKSFLTSVFDFLQKRGLKKAQQWEESAIAGLDKYNDCSKFIRNNMKEFRITLFRGVAQMSFYFLVPYMVFLAMGLSGHNVLEIFTLQAMLFVSTSGIPLPGAIGVSESVFLGLYATIFPAEILSSAMLLIRGINFYLVVLFTLAVTVLNIIILGRKQRKQQADRPTNL